MRSAQASGMSQLLRASERHTVQHGSERVDGGGAQPCLRRSHTQHLPQGLRHPVHDGSVPPAQGSHGSVGKVVADPPRPRDGGVAADYRPVDDQLPARSHRREEAHSSPAIRSGDCRNSPINQQETVADPQLPCRLVDQPHGGPHEDQVVGGGHQRPILVLRVHHEGPGLRIPVQESDHAIHFEAVAPRHQHLLPDPHHFHSHQPAGREDLGLRGKT
mmetsp:Transcript_2610/g.6180  ORF Transcript_2610/g.6180 Transcript_2610/m.6180 type:complete len:217 (+) Transcript_2610:115-765(+)